MQGKRGKANSWARLRGTLEAEGTVVAGESVLSFMVVASRSCMKKTQRKSWRPAEAGWGEGGARRRPTQRGARPRVLRLCSPRALGPRWPHLCPGPAEEGSCVWCRTPDPEGTARSPVESGVSGRAAWGAGWLRSGNAGPELSGEPRTVMPSRGSRGREDRGAAPGQPERGTGAAAAAEEARGPRLHSPGAGAAGGGVPSRGGHKGR